MADQSRLKAIFELALLAGAGLLAVWCMQILFFPTRSKPSAHHGDAPPRLRNSQGDPDLALLETYLRTTPPAPRDAAWAPPKLSNRWTYIAIHHSASNSGSAAGFDRYHRSRGMENGLAYHFVIGNGNGAADGEIEVGPRWTAQLQGGHVKGDALNGKAIGICLIGNLEKGIPTEKQIASLKALVNYLLDITNIPLANVQGHRNMPQQKTKCPGTFPVRFFLQNRLSPAPDNR